MRSAVCDQSSEKWDRQQQTIGALLPRVSSPALLSLFDAVQRNVWKCAKMCNNVCVQNQRWKVWEGVHYFCETLFFAKGHAGSRWWNRAETPALCHSVMWGCEMGNGLTTKTSFPDWEGVHKIIFVSFKRLDWIINDEKSTHYGVLCYHTYTGTL